MDCHTDPTELLSQVICIECSEIDENVFETYTQSGEWTSHQFPTGSILCMSPQVFHRVKPIQGKRRAIIVIFW